jgi:dTDP-4-dehydrorhamnose reductase
MRILITGANGQLGCELQGVLKDHALTCVDLPAFDVTKPDSERIITEARPELVIHAAAYTDVDGAEREPARALAVNADGTARVARAAATAGARLFYLSTDYVFDGGKRTPYLEGDEPSPVNVYGRSKLEGERRALAVCPDTLVIRTSWLYGAQGKNFVRTIMHLAATQTELRVVNDQRGCPTHAGDLAAAMRAMLDMDLKGIVHATGAGDCTWHEFASEIVSLLGSPARVLPVTSAESARPARRPAYSVLASTVLAGRGIRLPHWKDALTRFMQEAGVVGIKG